MTDNDYECGEQGSLIFDRITEVLASPVSEPASTAAEWSRIRDLPEQDREPFRKWLTGQTCPVLAGTSDKDQDGYYVHDYESWRLEVLTGRAKGPGAWD